MIVFRLSRAEYANDLSGKGAEFSGGRWNSKGIPVIYAAATRSLCTTEMAVHLPLGNVPDYFKMVSIEFPDNELIGEITEDQLSYDWKEFPHPHSTIEIGDRLLKQKKDIAIKAPSAIVPQEFLYLLNPLHKAAEKIRIVHTETFEFDKRLFVR